MDIYHRMRRNTTYEHMLLALLQAQCPGATFLDLNWLAPASFVRTTVNTQALLGRIAVCRSLSPRRRSKLTRALSDRSVPADIRVATDPSAITFDFAVIDNGKPLLLVEVHEKQHRNLSVSRLRMIYDVNGWPISVPRFLQRTVRDIWRAKVAAINSIPYLIVWFDRLNLDCSPIIWPPSQLFN